MAQTLFAHRAEGRFDLTPLDCFKEVLGHTQKAQSAAKEQVAALPSGAKDEYAVDEQRRELAQKAVVTALHEKTTQDEFNESNCAVATVAVFPCYLCCTGIGCSSLSSQSKINGLAPAVKYIAEVKEANATYTWSIQNYHYETRTRTVSDGKGGSRTETYTVRVNTHHASTSGTMRCTDESAMFVPNMRKRNCALTSTFNVTLDGAFAGEYHRRKQMFYAANTTDTHQDKSSSFHLPPMQSTLWLEWADDAQPDPWYANGGCCVLSVLTCTAVCWFVAMRDFVCEDRFKFQKRAHSFLH